MPNGKKLILDCSHNAECAVELEKNLALLLQKNGGKKPLIVAGVLGKERALPLLKVISNYAEKIAFVEVSEDRALTLRELESCLPKEHPQVIFSSVKEIFESCDSPLVSESECVVCTGSCYLAGEVLAMLKNSKRDDLQDILPKV